MLKILAILFVSSLTFHIQKAFAGPLATVPQIQEQDLQLLFDFRSDLWTSPYTYKDSPVRITGGSIRAPLFKTETWAASAIYYLEDLNLGRADFDLGQESLFVGNSLSNQIAGFGVRKSFARGSSMSVFAAIATASDKPWGGRRNEYFSGSVIYRTEMVDDHQWIFAVDQSDNRGLLNGKPFPYLGVAYFFGNDVYLSAGFPWLMVDWKSPKKEWDNSFFITPYGVTLRSSHQLRQNTVVGFLTGFTIRSYLYDERIDDEDRLFYQEIIGEGYISRAVTATTRVIFSLGAAVDRRLYETDDLYVPSSKMCTIDSDFYGRLSVEFNL